MPAGAFRGLEEWTGDCRRGAPVAGLQPHPRHGQLGVRAEQPRPTRRDRDALDHAGCLVRKGERALVLPEEPRRPGQMSRAAENLSGGLLGVRGGGPCLEHGDGLGRAPQLQQDPTQRRGGPALPFAAAQLGGERVGTAAQLEGATVVAPSAVDPAVRIEEQRLVAAIAELAVERERLISPCERLTEVPPRQRRLGRFEQGPGEEERVATAAMDLHEFLAMTLQLRKLAELELGELEAVERQARNLLVVLPARDFQGLAALDERPVEAQAVGVKDREPRERVHLGALVADFSRDRDGPFSQRDCVSVSAVAQQAEIGQRLDLVISGRPSAGRPRAAARYRARRPPGRR